MDIFERIAALRKEGKPFALATVVHSEDSTPRKPGARMIVHRDGSVEGTIGGGALEKQVADDAVGLLGEGRTEKRTYDLGENRGDAGSSAAGSGRTPEGGQTSSVLPALCGGRAEVLIESFSANLTLFIFGAGHVGKKLAELCAVLDIAHWVVDDREEFAKRELFPGAAGVLFSGFKESFSKLRINEHSRIVIVTYGHRHDGVCLEEALKTPAAYIGMIGSRAKVKALLESLASRGIDTVDPRIYAPVGLHLGDSSPGEIGVSIIAEILKIKSKGSGRHMREAG